MVAEAIIIDMQECFELFPSLTSDIKKNCLQFWGSLYPYLPLLTMPLLVRPVDSDELFIVNNVYIADNRIV